MTNRSNSGRRGRTAFARLTALLVSAVVFFAPDGSWAFKPRHERERATAHVVHTSARTSRTPSLIQSRPPTATPTRNPEARLLDIYRLIGASNTREALKQARSLVTDVPNFQLAQLVYADLLSAQAAPLRTFGAAPADIASFAAPDRLAQLREEAMQRIEALRERPPANTIPSQFIELPSSSAHAIAVDASRSRLYLFTNTAQGLHLLADHYVSLGRLGVDKSAAGDQRTPVGVYFVTSRLSGKQLANFYGTGALPLNYPNEYDRRVGRTGSGIWLHGVPPSNYARSPHSTDGCVVLSNPDLESLLSQVQPRSTPVVIAQHLDWVHPSDMAPERARVRNLLEGWRVARTSGDLNRTLAFYSKQFQPGTSDVTQWRRSLEHEVQTLKGHDTQIKDLSILTWHDKSEIMVVTFGEVLAGQRSGPIRRQYWGQEHGLWKIFYEGVIG